MTLGNNGCHSANRDRDGQRNWETVNANDAGFHWSYVVLTPSTRQLFQIAAVQWVQRHLGLTHHF